MSGLFSSGIIREWIEKITNGNAAFITQGYQEANSKLGTQWEAQRRLTGMSVGQLATSIIKTGSKPVDLKARLFAYTGKGVIARVYKDPVYTGGTEDKIYNMNTYTVGIGAIPQTKILTGIAITENGIEVAAPMFLIGPEGNTGKGALLSQFGSNRILAPSTSYLLTFESLDSSQDVTARLEFYEGDLDFP